MEIVFSGKLHPSLGSHLGEFCRTLDFVVFVLDKNILLNFYPNAPNKPRNETKKQNLFLCVNGFSLCSLRLRATSTSRWWTCPSCSAPWPSSRAWFWTAIASTIGWHRRSPWDSSSGTCKCEHTHTHRGFLRSEMGESGGYRSVGWLDRKSCCEFCFCLCGWVWVHRRFQSNSIAVIRFLLLLRTPMKRSKPTS